MPILLKAQPVTEFVYANLRQSVEGFVKQTKHTPTLATVLVGEDPASKIYVKKKGEMCLALGLGHRDFKLTSNASQTEVMNLIRQLNTDNTVDGILVQKPLPKHINEAEVFDLIDSFKDVDCFSPYNVGLLSQKRTTLSPCTPAGVMEILKYYKFNCSGKNALVIGRSDIVGKPMAYLLLHADATVTIAHSKTSDIAAHIERADLVVAAIGKANLLTGDLPWKPSCFLIDVGMNRDDAGKLTGDVHFSSVAEKVKAITPVPGGVGPMTIAMLMVNTARAAFLRKGLPLNKLDL